MITPPSPTSHASRSSAGRTAARCAAAAAVAVAVLAGCSSNSTDGHTQHLDDDTGNVTVSAPVLSPYPSQLQADDSDAESVALAAVRAVYDWRFAADDGPTQAVERATPLFSAALADTLMANPPQPFVNFRVWDRWKRDGATTRVSAAVDAEQHPADTASEWHRKISAAISITNRSGKPLGQWTVPILVTAQEQAGQWLVSQLQPLT